MRTGRWVVVCLILLFVCSNVTPAEEDLGKSNCRGIAELAHGIMKLRQEGFPMADLSDFFSENKMRERNPSVDLNGNEKMFTLIELMIRHAYTIPRHTTKKAREKEILDFQAEYYLECLNVLNKSQNSTNSE